VKKSGSLIGMSLVFIAGVLTGIGISAWKLDLGATGAHQAQKGQENSPKEEIKARISEIERTLASNPNNSQALIQLGSDYFDIGQYDKSIETYDKALKIDPKNAEITTDMAVAYRRLGKTDESVKMFRKALEIDPNQTLAMFNLGIVLRDDKKDLPAALKVWKTFLEKAPDSPHAVMIRPWVKQLEEKLGSKDNNPTESKSQ
jgi:tetratricopeptide (TPR) repeat protein